MQRRKGKREFSIRFGTLPNYLVAIVCAICATSIWPSKLSWGLLCLGGFAILVTWLSFDFGVDDSQQRSREGAGQSKPDHLEGVE